MKHLRLPVQAASAVLGALSAAQTAHADDNMDALRAELGALKTQYQTRIRRLEILTVLDRSQGDMHAQGNPHIQTDPRRCDNRLGTTGRSVI